MKIAQQQTMRGGRTDDRIWAATRGEATVAVLTDGASGMPGAVPAAECQGSAEVIGLSSAKLIH